MEFRDLKKQYQVLKKEMEAAIQAVCASGAFISGPAVQAFEDALADYVDVRHCVSCANGTDALTLAFMAWDIGPGDAVFVPDFTFFASGETVAFACAEPVFVDVCEDTFTMDPQALRQAIKATLQEGRVKPRVVMPVDMFGLPADYPSIRAICEEYGLLMLEDGAQGMGGEINGKHAPSFGDLSTVSFFPAKPLGCYGDGGAIFSNDEGMAALLRSLCVHGKGSHKYDNARIGINSRLDTIQAAILSVKLSVFEKELISIRKIASWYDELLIIPEVSRPIIPKGYESGYAQYTIRTCDEKMRNRLISAFQKKEIPYGIYYPIPMHMQKSFATMPCSKAHCPTTENLCKTVISLPIHPYMKEEEVEMISKTIKEEGSL